MRRGGRGHVVRLACAAGPARIDQPAAELRVEQLQRQHRFHAALPGLFGEVARLAAFGWATGLHAETAAPFAAVMIFSHSFDGCEVAAAFGVTP